MTILSKNNQSGRSMVEMLGVLAIIGVLSVGGISGYSKAMAKFKLTKAQDQVVMLLMNIRTAYATSPNYDGLSAATAATFNLAPADMVVGTSLYSTFGGSVDVGACTGDACVSGATTSNYFYIKMDGLGQETCRSLASSDWGTDGMAGMKIGDETQDSLPVSLGAANTACGTGNSITWVYY